MRGYLVILLAAAGIACGQAPIAPGPGPTAGDLKSSLSMAFDGLAIPAGAACSISISQHGQVVLERGRGETAPGRPASADSPYRIGSCTKPITATAVLVSGQAGRLNPADKINRFLAYPEPAPTIDELIKHIPGLSALPPNGSGSSPTTLQNLLSLIQPWDGVPRYKYSSWHYVLLGAVLEQVNGLRYEEIVQRDIFGPAGMSRSSFEIPLASESVSFPVTSQTHPSWGYAGGGATSTAADMNRFNQALLSNHFGFGALESLSGGGFTSFGMASSQPNGDRRFTHTGYANNYSSLSNIFPADRSSVVVLCNFNNVDSLPAFAGSIRSIMLAGK